MSDIKADFGAHGDGQLQTLIVSFTSGSPNLTVFSNTFTSGDVNKCIAVMDWVTGSITSNANAVLCTISSVGAFSSGSQTLVLSAFGGTNPNAANTVTSVSKQVEWGTPDDTAFTNFNNAYQGQTGVVLTIPAGRYCFCNALGNTTFIGIGITGLTINGSSSPVLTDMLGSALSGEGYTLGGARSALFNDNQAESTIKTVSAGSSTLYFTNVVNASKYTVNTWALLTGLDLQGYGSPPNPAFFEYVYITVVDTVGGSVTVQSPLQNSYKSTWPRWDSGVAGSGAPNYTGGSFSLGGPATLYLIPTNWNCVHVWNNVGFRCTNTVKNANGRDITFNGCFFESFAINVSEQKYLTINNCGTISVLWEWDKITENFTLSNTTLTRGYFTQSPSPANITLSNVTISNEALGTGKNFTATNCSFPSSMVGFGASPYGSGDSVNISNCTFAGQTAIIGSSESDLTGVGAYSISNGLISRLKNAGPNPNTAPPWAVPGHYCFFKSRTTYEEAFKILDVYEDGTSIYIQTSMSGGWPSVVSPATTLGVIVAPPINCTFTSCSGCDDAVSWSNIQVNLPLYSRWSLLYSGDIGAWLASHAVKVAGNIVSIKVTVNTGYSAGTFTLAQFLTVLQKPQNVSTQSWSPSFDLTTPGARIITPNGVTGSAGLDSGLTLPNNGNIWLNIDSISPGMSGVSGSGSVLLEIITNQGISTGTNIPFYLRLHT